MGLFFDHRVFTSEKNGRIVVERILNRTSIFVDGFDQSSRYITEMWKQALLRVPSDHTVKHVLILGLAGGNAVRLVHRKFKDAHVTVVEWDPVMVDLAKTLRLFSRKHMPEIVTADAVEFVQKTQQTFDLIIVDLFHGEIPEPRLASEEMISSLSHILNPDGYLLLNPFKNISLIPAFDKKFSRQDAWHYRFNALAVYRHFGQGTVGDPPPVGFDHQMQSPAYLAGGWEPDATNVESVGKSGCVGRRWHYGPFWVEAYTTDVQPEIDYTAHSRVVIWQPVTKKSRPVGWHRSWIQMNPQQHGFGDIEGKTEYWSDWTDHAKRHRKKWLKDESYEIVEVPLEEFGKAYHASGKLPSMRKDFIKLLIRRIKTHGDDVHLFVARNKQTKQIISGLAVCDLPDVSCSMHLVAFLHPKFEKTSAGVGLIDHWYKHCQTVGIRFPHFGLIWAPGDPRSWKGYSKFKRNFNLFVLKYPLPLIRFVKQKKS